MEAIKSQNIVQKGREKLATMDIPMKPSNNKTLSESLKNINYIRETASGT
jgi:hypothetical protein